VPVPTPPGTRPPLYPPLAERILPGAQPTPASPIFALPQQP
jgi:hypothetical protein